MQPRSACGTCGHCPQGTRPSGPRLRALLLLLLLLPRRPADPDVSCAFGAPRPRVRLRLPRQAESAQTTNTPTKTTAAGSPATGPPATGTRTSGLPAAGPPAAGTVFSGGTAFTETPSSFPACGFSHEADPTLRDPEAMTRRWPWMVSVQANGTHVCAGTLIASQWVLTVAHCLGMPRVNYTVRVGSPWINQSSETTSDIPVLQIIINSGYHPRRFWSWVGRTNDISLLKLQQKLKFSKYVWPVCLPGLEYVIEDNSVCTVTGWGSPKVEGAWPEFLTLQEKEVTIMSRRDCENFYHEFSRISSLVQIVNSQMICTSDDSREEFCYEMTGEPLVCSSGGTWYLVGMASWGAGCKNSEAPPIFVHVSTFQPWIWDRLSGQPMALPVPPRTMLLVLPLPLSLLASL